MRDDRCQGLKRAHPVVEALLLDAVVLSALGDDLFGDVGLAESLSDVARLLRAHLADGSSCVGQVCEEKVLEASLENFLAEVDTEISDKLEDSHTNAPLGVLGEGGQKVDKGRVKNFSSDNGCAHFQVLSDIETNLRVLVLKAVLQDGENG